MSTLYEIPLSPMPQRFSMPLPATPGSNVPLILSFIYRSTDIAGGCGWTLDIASEAAGPLACGIPLVTGTDLLAQFRYLGLVGQLWVFSDAAPTDAVPRFDNLGLGAHLYWWLP